MTRERIARFCSTFKHGSIMYPEMGKPTPADYHLADAFLALTCGAVDVNSNIASFSSDGPTVDGREKPEVLARGLGTQTVHADNDSGIVA